MWTGDNDGSTFQWAHEELLPNVRIVHITKLEAPSTSVLLSVLRKRYASYLQQVGLHLASMTPSSP